MDLRAFLHTQFLVFLFIVLGSLDSRAAVDNDSPLVPYEIKFADVTFQLTDVTRYLVQTELKNIQADKSNLRQQLDKFNLFLPVVEPVLKEKVVPDDFKFLMIYNKYQSSIETSTFLENGVYWCLDREKADDVDLIVNDQLDERKHLIAATKGAAICFKRNQVLYRNWASTLFSHLADKKILTLLEVNKKWAENPYILLDTPAYSAILQFLAYKIAIEREFPIYKPVEQKIVYEYPYSKGKTLNKIALDLKVEPETLFEYNKWLNSVKVPESDCNVLVIVPANRYSEVRTFAELSRKIGLPAKDLGFPILKREDKLSKTKSKGGVFYLINDLEGLQADMCDIPVTMAYKAGISVERFAEYNDIKENDLLKIGQVYYIESKTSKASVPFHVVRDGETLWDISQMYGVKLSSLLNFNRFETVQRLQRGRVLWLQTTRPKNKPIEYIEMPDEMTEVEEMMVAGQNKNLEKEFILDDTVQTVEVKSSLKDVDLSSLPLSQEIGKGQQSQIMNKNDLASTKQELPKEVDLSILPLTKEIGKGNQQSKVTSKKEVPKEIEPLTQDIRKGNTNSVNLSKSIDRKQVTEGSVVQDEEQTVTWNKQNSTKNKPYSVEVADREENKNFLKHTVKKGETLFRISVNYNVAVSELWVWNNLTSTIVNVGTVLKVKR
ncbi:LysM peptidoglycan-binding domain-containing protein [Emticicia oligotrophica]|uniref:LysM peptidoglycan-binding domain-containing protein n=1 Tax=Emticicia oligotrophica TaxID=312279 RepID=UPI00273AAE86|nr:LysM peptidoglycan-binding domain-containing protein [Emticicia oligotrophica]